LHPQSPQGGNAIQNNKPPFRKKGGLKNKKLTRRFPASLIERGVMLPQSQKGK
jgi:hypothetical protein